MRCAVASAALNIASSVRLGILQWNEAKWNNVRRRIENSTGQCDHELWPFCL